MEAQNKLISFYMEREWRKKARKQQCTILMCCRSKLVKGLIIYPCTLHYDQDELACFSNVVVKKSCY